MVQSRAKSRTTPHQSRAASVQCSSASFVHSEKQALFLLSLCRLVGVRTREGGWRPRFGGRLGQRLGRTGRRRPESKQRQRLSIGQSARHGSPLSSPHSRPSASAALSSPTRSPPSRVLFARRCRTHNLHLVDTSLYSSQPYSYVYLRLALFNSLRKRTHELWICLKSSGK